MPEPAVLTKTEGLRRLRIAARLAREACRLPKNVRVEVGVRIHPQAAARPSGVGNEILGDDLSDFADLDVYAANVVPGAEVHLYFSKRDGYNGWELEDVCTAWLGPNPVLLTVNGRRQEIP